VKEIEVIIDEDGQTSIDLQGWNGKGCSEIAKQIAKAMGTTIKLIKKNDYWKTETKIKQKVRGM